MQVRDGGTIAMQTANVIHQANVKKSGNVQYEELFYRAIHQFKLEISGLLKWYFPSLEMIKILKSHGSLVNINLSMYALFKKQIFQ